MKYKLAILDSHPIQYRAPLFKKLTQHPRIDLHVYYCLDYGVIEKLDPGFCIRYKWDIPLLEGYHYKFLRNFSLTLVPTFLGQINLGVIKELFRNKYDAVWIHGWMSITNWLVILTALFTKTPIFLRGENPLNNERFKPKWKIIIKKPILRWLFRRISAFLYIGEENKKFYLSYGVSQKNLFFVPYAVDNERFTKSFNALKDKKNKLKESLGIGPERVVILFCAKLTERKKPLDLFLAYERIEYPHKALVYIGDGYLRTELESYVKNNKIKDVYLVGFKNQTELPFYYAIADIFVLPSKSEPWGNVVNEAMNFALPIITNDKVGAAYDLVKSGENGFIYPSGNIKSLSGYLLKLLQDSELRTKMGKRSLEIISKWNYDICVQGIHNALEESYRRGPA